MGLKGMLVMTKSGVPIYSKFIDENVKMDPSMIAGLMSAIQAFASEMTTETISEFTMKNMKVLYRHMDGIIFLGLMDATGKSKHDEIILEYLIYIFLAKYKEGLACDNEMYDIEGFRDFDEVFIEFRAAKEKELQRCVENSTTGLLQCILNRLANYFPVTELVGISGVLKLIGKKLVWVDINIPNDEKDRIVNLLREKTDFIYGSGMFETIRKNIITNARK